MNCSSLTTIEQIYVNGVDLLAMFSGCSSLTNITVAGYINYDVSFSDCTRLSFDSIKSILTACSNTVDPSREKNISFNRTIADQNNELTNLVSTCTEKGWVISGLTLE